MEKRITRTWERREVLETRKIRSTTSRYNFETTHQSKIRKSTLEGEFLITIDVDAIARMLSGRAANSQSGKSAFMQGMVKAKRLSEREVSREEKSYPVPEGYEDISDLAKIEKAQKENSTVGQ